MSTQTKPRWQVGALALAIAMALPGTALAQTDKERELEARVAQLEHMVQQLLQNQQAGQAATEQHISQQVSEQVAAKVAEVVANPDAMHAGGNMIQRNRITLKANPNTDFSYGGFIKFDTLLTDTSDGQIAENSAGRLFFVPGTIPVSTSEVNTKPTLDVHSQFSRFWLGTDTTLDTGDKVRSYFEADLFGTALGNENNTNTFGLSIRHAYVAWNKWLAGQTWSNFQDTAALPDTVDFLGVSAGTVFVRQSQLRYTNGAFSVSLENPRTVATPFGTSGRISSNSGQLPDMTARYVYKADWGHLSFAGLLRQLAVEEPATGIDDRTFGGGVSFSGRYNLGSNDDLRFMANYGEGISRYVGFSINSDVNVDATNKLDTIGMFSGYAAWHHMFNKTLRGNLYAAFARFDNDTSLSSANVTESVSSLHANLIWTVLPMLDVGAEAMWATREIETGNNGDLTRLQFHVKYSF
ncbi:MAG: DcaP family trimeric outer membrane transporter [Xanthomonadaceae bacterium]|nr:DcaP family trimeric outer membrane transporter [Xanthomonadaceae bacterium]MDP2186180.1 DcaP family trimeric outer membrane transporter [Xanthomonadales bacterium]MDZ4114899.1 DcaP family trimeric outer membrane transporter [Xanthomonadaceae bacterium]MDZ4377483.1 DcaP family trimeric outer membrane transporter [Xanthomonadaceae bacterium]